MVEDARIAAAVDLTGRIEGFLGRCESPIELAFAQSLVLASHEGPFPWGWYFHDAGDLGIFFGRFGWERGRSTSTVFIGAASQVEVPRLSWRVDFLLIGRRYGADETLAAIVECDGHDFHERTPEQAARDRARDREAQNAGMKVLRFTGREIWRDPRACVDEVETCFMGLLPRLEGRAGA